MALLTERLLLAELFRLYPDPERLFSVAYRAGEKLGEFAASRSLGLRSDAAALALDVWKTMFGRAAQGAAPKPQPRGSGSGGQAFPAPALVLEGARLPEAFTEPYEGEPRYRELFRSFVEGAVSGAFASLGWDADVRYEGEELSVSSRGETY